jgi:hypothetical protein
MVLLVELLLLRWKWRIWMKLLLRLSYSVHLVKILPPAMVKNML